MAENNTNDSTSFQQAEFPTTCAKGCGFYGTEATMNMCSKCYRDHLQEENQTAAARAAVSNSFSLSKSNASAPAKLVLSAPAPHVEQKQEEEEEEEKAVVDTPPKPKNRCGSCNKKVGMLGFQCKCGSTFCGSHRYPEEHKCTYDFVGVGKKAIEKANPVIKADKIDRF